MRRDGGSVFPAHANTGDPNGPNRGLSANENARALISMMARSKCSNQRPDTLMQDRSPPARRNHLQRTAGPYIKGCLGTESGLLASCHFRIRHYRRGITNVKRVSSLVELTASVPS